jgi:hypothetical protein
LVHAQAGWRFSTHESSSLHDTPNNRKKNTMKTVDFNLLMSSYFLLTMRYIEC